MKEHLPTQMKFCALLGIILTFICQGRLCSAEPVVSSTPPLAAKVSLVAPQAALTEEQISTLLPDYVQDPVGWARDVAAAFHENRFYPSLTNVCMALAVIQQESSFQANPIVPDLSEKVLRELHHIATRKLGPVGPRLVDLGLQVTIPGNHATLAERLRALRSERDLDRLYQELLSYFRTTFPHLFALSIPLVEWTAGHVIEDFSPVTTIGPMQVSIRFAKAVATERGHDIRRVRDELYTRRGGVAYGIVRLLDYQASYASPRYIFADFNTGRYASRNAALQQQVSWLTGMPLTADGDLLTYDVHGQPGEKDSKSLKAIFAFRQRYVPSLSKEQVRQDVRLEKSKALEETKTYRAIKRSYEREFRTKAAYARIPEVKLESVKLKNPKDNLWFALSVEQKYRRCSQRYQRVRKRTAQVTRQSSAVEKNAVTQPISRRSPSLIKASRVANARSSLVASIASEPTRWAGYRETPGAIRQAGSLTREEVARKIKWRLQREGFVEVTIGERGLVITLRGEVRSRREWQRVFAIAREEVNAGRYTLDQRVDIVGYQ